MAILAIQRPTFQPSMRIIDLITNANPAIVTTSFDHNYIDGLIVRIRVPTIGYGIVGWGMSQINGLTGTITILSDDSFSVTIDSTTFDAFVSGYEPSAQQFCQVVPIGEINSELDGAVQNVLPYSAS